MANPIKDCTSEEQCSVIGFLVAEGLKSNEIVSRMLVQYGRSCMNRPNVLTSGCWYKLIDLKVAKQVWIMNLDVDVQLKFLITC